MGSRRTEDGHPSDAGNGLLEQLQHFPTEGPRDRPGYPCDVAAWPRQCLNELGRNWINNRQDNNRDRRSRLLGGVDPWCTRRNDDVNPALDELGRQIGQLISPLRPSVLKDDVLSLNIAKPMQRLPEYLKGVRVTVRRNRTEQEKTDLGNFSRLLRIRNERRQEDTEGESDNEPDSTKPHGGVLPNTHAR